MSKPILFYISHGHGTGADKGAASGKFVELELNKKVSEALREYLLETRGCDEYKATYPERKSGGFSLAMENAKKAYYNAKYRVVAIDIHFNAGGGKGAEIYCKDTKYSKELGELIIGELKAIKRPIRPNPVRGDNNYTFLKGKGTNVLLEVGFVDNKEDRKGFDTDKELKQIGVAIGKAMKKYYKKYK